ncbi:glutathione-S-transferase theta, GST, putative [Talaromyces stipitatus ATCC 10500]|uniref:glutathione transferase n=1 Tax=Talaromyces stipitatus (strain ATCC 10500 / CBS 375.48 / QM 6759 / NRRL 1006) TaxID=441959 RepID=B8LVA5_TALSN|nr:glutathione-S-transferase theta, GST, putative [Talaromyces stipitatus ATCC 10500]EED23155.1 glutathione-S-transferase theta, GST, putative [Talaromyces stipitatus ATCC 10500]
MAFKLYGSPLSGCTQRVLLVLAEKGVEDFELLPVNLMKGEHKMPNYTEKHPFGVIPLLEEGEFRLFESRAISRYLAIKYKDKGTSLVPSAGDWAGWALFEQWAAVESSNFHYYCEQILTQKMWNPYKGLPTVDAILDDATKRFEEKLDTFDKVLGTQEYLGGKEFSLIDIFYMPAVALLFRAGAGSLIELRPNWKAWWQRVSTRPSWEKVSASAAAAAAAMAGNK